MPLPAFFYSATFVFLKTSRPQSDAVLQLHMVTDSSCLADNYTGAVVDKEITADLGARVNIDPGPAMSPFRHHSREKRELLLVELVG